MDNFINTNFICFNHYFYPLIKINNNSDKLRYIRFIITIYLSVYFRTIYDKKEKKQINQKEKA